MRVLKRVPFEQPDMITKQLQMASKICVQLAEYYLGEKDYTNALKYYKDAISYYDADNKVSNSHHPPRESKYIFHIHTHCIVSCPPNSCNRL